MQIGKLYQIKKHFWLLYPSKETAAAGVAGPAGGGAAGAADYSDYWSKELNCNVTYIPENGIFCFLEQNGKFLKVLSTNGELGWIIYSENEEWARVYREQYFQELKEE